MIALMLRRLATKRLHRRSERPRAQSAAMAGRVGAARVRRRLHFVGLRRATNADIGPAEVCDHCRRDATGDKLVRAAVRQPHLSARAQHRVLKLARTIADGAGAGVIGAPTLPRTLQDRTRSITWRDARGTRVMIGARPIDSRAKPTGTRSYRLVATTSR